MPRYAFDIETNGLLDTMTKIHSLVLQDVDTGEVHSLHGKYIEDGLYQLQDADQIIGHNIIQFDIPAIQKIYPWFTIERGRVFDTLVMSRLLWADMIDRDARAVFTGVLPARLRGSHSLEAWGYRLGKWKGDYAKEMKAKGLDPWVSWNPKMQEYCEQDVEVTVEFLSKIESKDTDPRAIALEHEVAHILWEQEQTGFTFDLEAALGLLKTLQEERAEVESKLQNLFDPWLSYVGEKTPKRTVNYKDPMRHSTWEGATYSEVKVNVFNPGSRAHIADRLMTVRGWEPKQFTSKGQPKVDDEILGALPYPEAQQIAYYLMLQKRIGQVYEGRNSWIRLYNKETGRIHGRVVTNGAVTGRMTHNYPNVAQTPSVQIGKDKKPLKGSAGGFGYECRSCWTVPPGKKQVGIDVSGLELRMLAHYMAPHDGGVYGRTVVEGDVHTANMEAAGLSDRNQAKTFIYAFLYGAGNTKIGSIVGKGPKIGGRLKQRFLEQTPALNKLIKGVTKKSRTTGTLKGLDGRVLSVRHQHAALNTLLQSAGALVCKRWLVECEKERRDRGWTDRVKYIANIHDEIQFEVDEEIAQEWGEIGVECIRRAGEYFGIRVPLTGEAKIGSNWAECH